MTDKPAPAAPVADDVTQPLPPAASAGITGDDGLITDVDRTLGDPEHGKALVAGYVQADGE